jgi:hypothetical protein
MGKSLAGPRHAVPDYSPSLCDGDLIFNIGSRSTFVRGFHTKFMRIIKAPLMDVENRFGVLMRMEI